MKKKIILRSLVGVPIGVFISVIVAVFISYSIGDGSFHYVSYNLIHDCGNEINAVFWQFIMVIFYGAIWGGASVVWEMEEWSILKQSMVHFLVTVLSTLIVAFTLNWFERNVTAFLIYLAIFFVIYIVIWLFWYFSMKSKINMLNDKLQ